MNPLFLIYEPIEEIQTNRNIIWKWLFRILFLFFFTIFFWNKVFPKIKEKKESSVHRNASTISTIGTRLMLSLVASTLASVERLFASTLSWISDIWRRLDYYRPGRSLLEKGREQEEIITYSASRSDASLSEFAIISWILT